MKTLVKNVAIVVAVNTAAYFVGDLAGRAIIKRTSK